MAEAALGPAAVSQRADQIEDESVRECCQRAWLAALTLAENVLLDQVYDQVQLRTPHDAVRQCVLALRLLKEMGRPWCSRED